MVEGFLIQEQDFELDAVREPVDILKGSCDVVTAVGMVEEVHSRVLDIYIFWMQCYLSHQC